MFASLQSKIKAWLSSPEFSQAVSSWGWRVVLTSAVVTGVVVVTRQFGVWQAWELGAFDRFLSLRPDEGVDDRLLVVGINEDDIREYLYPIPDEILGMAIQKIEQGKPRTVGVDIFRDIPIQKGRQTLISALKTPNVVVVCGMSQTEASGFAGVKPPEGIAPEQVGFADFSQDLYKIQRRATLISQVFQWQTPPPESHLCNDPNEILYSLGLRLALNYLAQEGIEPDKEVFENEQQLLLKDALFTSLDPNGGGYIGVGEGDYQTIINYRSRQPSQVVSLRDVMQGKVPPDLIRDRVVLIGYTAPTVGDFFQTPYTTNGGAEMSGVEVHAQVVSQIISAALDNRPLIGYIPDPLEWLLILASALVGGLLVIPTKRYLWLFVIVEGIAVVVLVGACYGAFLAALWLPVVPSSAALLLTALGVYLGENPLKKMLKADGNIDWDLVREAQNEQKEADEKEYRQEFFTQLQQQAKMWQQQAKNRDSLGQRIVQVNSISDQRLMEESAESNRYWLDWLEEMAIMGKESQQQWFSKSQDKFLQEKKDHIDNLLQKSRFLRKSQSN